MNIFFCKNKLHFRAVFRAREPSQRRLACRSCLRIGVSFQNGKQKKIIFRKTHLRLSRQRLQMFQLHLRLFRMFFAKTFCNFFFFFIPPLNAKSTHTHTQNPLVPKKRVCLRTNAPTRVTASQFPFVLTPENESL